MRCIDLLEGSFDGSYPPENALDTLKAHNLKVRVAKQQLKQH